MDQALRKEIKYAVENSPFYKNHFSGYKIDGMSMNDFRNLPFTTKHDVSKNNQDFYCISRKEIKEFVTTSGTSGSPITIPLSKTDLERLAINESIALTKMGFDKSDTFQLLVTLDRQFMAGIAYYSGILRMGATVLRNGPGGLIGQLKSIEDFNPTVLIAVPSFILKLVDFSKTNGFNLENSSVKAIVCIGEPIHNSDFTLNNIAQSIVDKWKVRLCSTYASTEMATAFYQCKNNLGCHNNDDLIFTEVLNENGEQVASGEIGEIVVTTIGIQAALIRRNLTKQGSYIDISMLDCQTAILENAVSRYYSEKKVPKKIGSRHPSIAPFECFKCKDDYIAIAAGNDGLFEKLCYATNSQNLLNLNSFKTND